MLMNKVIVIFIMKIYAQITIKKIHLLFVHDDKKSNNGQIGQVVAMGGSEKPKIFSCAC